jgi:hypothetical protein
LAQALELLQREKRLSYRVLRRRLGMDDDELEDLKEDLIYAKKLAVDEAGRVLVWTGSAVAEPPPTSPGQPPDQTPLTYTPPHLMEKILASRRPRRRAQAGHGALCRPQRLDGTHPGP